MGSKIHLDNTALIEAACEQAIGVEHVQWYVSEEALWVFRCQAAYTTVLVRDPNILLALEDRAMIVKLARGYEGSYSSVCGSIPVYRNGSLPAGMALLVGDMFEVGLAFEVDVPPPPPPLQPPGYMLMTRGSGSGGNMALIVLLPLVIVIIVFLLRYTP